MKVLTAFILLISISPSKAQPVDMEKLRSALTELERQNNSGNQQTFFELFPNSFESFEQTFGYKNGKAAPLYDGREYITQFFSLDSIPVRQQINKWINISINGHWDADAVSYFQHHLRPKTFKHIDLVYEVLKKRREQDIESFFYFFFNGVHPQYKALPNELDRIKNRDATFYRLIAKGHQRAIEDSGH